MSTNPRVMILSVFEMAFRFESLYGLDIYIYIYIIIIHYDYV